MWRDQLVRRSGINLINIRLMITRFTWRRFSRKNHFDLAGLDFLPFANQMPIFDVLLGDCHEGKQYPAIRQKNSNGIMEVMPPRPDNKRSLNMKMGLCLRVLNGGCSKNKCSAYHQAGLPDQFAR